MVDLQVKETGYFAATNFTKNAPTIFLQHCQKNSYDFTGELPHVACVRMLRGV
jgi:hypothetical protein